RRAGLRGLTFLWVKEAWTRPRFAKRVGGVAQRAGFDRKAAAAYALIEAVAKPRQLGYARIEICAPVLRQPAPVGCGGRTPLGQCPKRCANSGQRNSQPLRHLDHCYTAQNVPPVAALVATGAVALDQAFGLIEMQRRDGNAAAPGHLAHAQLARDVLRGLTRSIDIRHESPILKLRSA